MPMLNMRFVLPDHIIDLNRVEGLSYHPRNRGRARDRRDDAPARSRILRPRRAELPADARGDPQVGHRQTRNRGTFGGSLCHLDPSAELVSLAAALDATVVVAGPEGQRDDRVRAISRVAT